MLGYILGFSLLGGVGTVLGTGVLLAYPSVLDKFRTYLLAFAIGTLLGATFLGLLPNAIDQAGPRPVLFTTMAAIILFFMGEKVLRVPHVHSHAGEHPGYRHPSGWFILLGDALHNFVDGIVITTAFMASIPLGITTALAVILHELPQELGDFSVLVHSGWKPWKAFWANLGVSLLTVPGALLAYWMLPAIQPYIPYLLAVAAASFLYIATTDLAPILHHESRVRQSIFQLIWLLLGVGLLIVLMLGLRHTD